MSHATIELNQVTKHFQRQTGEQVVGLNNINLKINAGEVIGVIGTNGAGKSTLMNCLTGQLPIDSGEILIEGVAIRKMKKRDVAKKIGRVFQNPQMGTAPRMNVFENLMLGQRQAVSLIMATIQKPELLLLDEHTAALDPRTAKQVMAMTQLMIKNYGLTTLMITHHLQDALDYCDRLIVMHRGQISRIYQKTELASLTAGDLYQTLENLVIEDAK
uniref:ABC transporter ATP-binding protein n=1 Tax=Globicatella sulfidifaciens TaxID=136093 RepID=UPI0023F078D4|nr:ATP-binding cassette domain-containing protein [Globicatella sulfidifaciens]